MSNLILSGFFIIYILVITGILSILYRSNRFRFAYTPVRVEDKVMRQQRHKK